MQVHFKGIHCMHHTSKGVRSCIDVIRHIVAYLARYNPYVCSRPGLICLSLQDSSEVVARGVEDDVESD